MGNHSIGDLIKYNSKRMIKNVINRNHQSLENVVNQVYI